VLDGKCLLDGGVIFSPPFECYHCHHSMYENEYFISKAYAKGVNHNTIRFIKDFLDSRICKLLGMDK